MSEAGPVVYDPVELRRRIAVAFSIGELRALAESLGVGGIAWDRGLDEAAREVVRQCERYAGLPSLVARLREERPLVEWPAPRPANPAPYADGTIPRTLVSEIDAPAVAAPPAFAPLSATPGAFGPPAAAPQAPAAPALSGPTFRDPFAAPQASSPPTRDGGPPPSYVPANEPPAPPSIASVPRAPWPGTVAPAPAKPAAGIDPRIFILVAGLMVMAAVIAYLAGRASTAPGADASAAATAAAGPGAPAARGDGPTAHVADVFTRSFANMARACELPSSAGTDAFVFRRIFEHCGPSAPPQQRRPSPTSTTDPSLDPVPTPEPPPARPRRPARGGDGPGDPAPVAPAKSCMSTCDGQHSACRAHCGPEPTEGSAYDNYTRCMGGCLKDASRCRLSCR